MVTIADKLKSKRKEYGMSQSELADGICEQSQISKIERGSLMPTALLLHQLADRLKVTMDYFFDDEVDATSNLKEFISLSSKLLENRNYKDLEYLYNLEKEKHSFLTVDDMSYLTWIQSLISFYNDNDSQKAIALLEDSITTINKKHSIYLKTLNTLANFYSLVGQDDNYAINYQKLIQLYATKDFDSQEILFGYIRTRYNYAHHLLSKNQNLEAIQIAMETIDCCKTHKTSYQLAALLILVGNGSQSFLDTDKVMEYYLEARDLCRVYGNELTYLQIENYIKELNSKNNTL